MTAQNDLAPIIIKKKKNVIGGGHHGGAWKVAYADFVTAMMAFFMLMWLLSSTSEQQKAGLADYFDPTVTLTKTSGGGSGPMGGDSTMSENTMAKSGQGTGGATDGGTSEEQHEELLSEVKTQLLAKSGESMTMERLLRHIASKVTDEGLVIELFDHEDAPLFTPETDQPTETLKVLTQVLSDVFQATPNRIAINGHVRSYPKMLMDDPTWSLSRARSEAVRRLMLRSGTNDERIERVSGFADRKTVTPDPSVIRNNRVEIILLRTDR